MFLPAILILIDFIGVRSAEVELAKTSPAISSPNPLNAHNRTEKHNFFRSLLDASEGVSARRLFGGTAAELKEFAAVCSLLNEGLNIRCTCTLLSPRWALTAGHCVKPSLYYVRYNTRQPSSTSGRVADINGLFRHPSYRVIEQGQGENIDVTLLHNDIGLVMTKIEMVVDASVKNLLGTLLRYNPSHLLKEEVKVFGFGKSEKSAAGEELFSMMLQLVSCEPADWYHCICAVRRSGQGGGACGGDSGGPVLYKDALIGVTSMGSADCDSGKVMSGTSVFTSLYQYANFINDTIFDKDTALRISKRSHASSLHKYSFLIIVNVIFLEVMK